MRVLFATGSAAGYMRPPILGDEQIVCGPDWTDERSSDGRVRSLKTPVGEYDLAAIAAKLPKNQQPDVVVCLVDAAWRNLPRNLTAFACPKVLLIADTHHLTTPLMSMLRYMASEPYDRSVFLYDRHHASFFHAAGFRNLYWFPGLTFPHSDEKVRKARAQGVRQPQIAFVGQVGFLHPLRSRMYTTLLEKKLPVLQKKLSQEESLGFYGSSLLAFNASLNGDLNLRVFETLSTGAALLTDRLAPESGLERLLVDGREMLTYGSADELIEKATHALANPRETQAIGLAGSDWFDKRYNEAWRRKAFQELAFDGKAVPEFEFSPEEKTRVYFGGDTDRLLQAMMVYEGVQEIHRVEPAVKVALDANVPEDVAAMYATLPRLTTQRVGNNTNEVFDVAVFGRNVTVVPTARCLWCWDAQEGDADALGRQLGSAGYGLASRDVAMFCQVQQAMPDSYASASHWHYLGVFHRKHGKPIDALAALLQAVALNPEGIDSQMELGITALAYGHGTIAREAFTEVLRFRPDDKEATRGLAKAKRREVACDYERPRDLLISHVEVTRLQGTGVLIQRFFPDSDDFITVRSRSLYGNKVDFGGTHYAIDLPRISDEARAGILRRILKPYRIRRIIAVPFFPTDLVHALIAKEATGAPLCTYVMDDQTLYSKEVPQELAQKLFDASDLRLAISPEMITEYTAKFRCSFGLLPPIVTNRENEKPNTWSPAVRDSKHCAMVGNIWSAQQFEQLRAFVSAAGLKVDWFGNSNVPWLPQNHAELEAEGLYCKGFLAEDLLAERLSTYPFVLLPSGMLDGSEKNEWLTRLSLPSRMVFILTKTLTPMLVLGSGKTAAARFVNQFGLGTSSNYDAAGAPDKIAQITAPERRGRLLENARRIATCFLLPDCGAWIWRSLAAKQPEPTPFDHLYSSELDAVAASLVLLEAQRTILARLASPGFLDSHLAPDEPRQKSDIRGAVLYIHKALELLGPRSVQLSILEQLDKQQPNSRPVLVVWAELLEQAGDLATAAAKARKALSLFYDDVYTQTLFLRCGGGKNFHTDAKDRFCPHPFENFEIYKDGSVYPCNCTQVPFPIGNAHTQTIEEIWQSPQAKAIRESILDGSYRFCSPMTCWQRFNLPKKAEQPERFKHLQEIGVEGKQMPKHLNLSYDLSCNLSCPSCRNATIMATQEERKTLDHVRENIVLPLLRNKDAESVYITGSGDAFGSPHFRGILKELCDPQYAHVQITLGTNGQLITERLWEEFTPLHARFQDITISIDGAIPETYERLRRGSTWEKLERTMGILSHARRTGEIRCVMVNMVVQEDNFLEMRPMLALCRAWAVDRIRFYRIRQWGNVQSNAFMASDVANPLHPRHQELLAELAHPDFADGIVDHYDMYELISREQGKVAQKARELVPQDDNAAAARG
jgi:radical SAM protein with 4Fe4S-binding SPASM domain